VESLSLFFEHPVIGRMGAMPVLARALLLRRRDELEVNQETITWQ
jgi:hypothetical protein